jgi:hypothetical protein
MAIVKKRLVLGPVTRMCAVLTSLSWVVAPTGCGAQHGQHGSGRGTASSYLTDITGESELTTWDCVGDPCPWGQLTSNHALAWPASVAPIAARLGYAVSPAAYLPAELANGMTLSIESGSAGVFAGEPDAEGHTFLTTISPGQSYFVSGLLAGEVLSVQSDDSFEYRVTKPDPGESPDAGPTPDAEEEDPTPDAGSDETPPTGSGIASQTVTWTCTGSPCPFGESTSNPAIVWPADVGASSARLGYTVSAAIYLPASRANGVSVSVEVGAANILAGPPDASGHRFLGTVSAGQTFHVNGIVSGEVLSVQGDDDFLYRVILPAPTDPEDDPPPGDVIHSVPAFWRCNVPDCFGAPWTAAVINWPPSAAFQNNDRSGSQSRSVFGADNTPLFPYMQSWAEGCEVTVVSGVVLIVEWERGTDVWRETWLQPGESHTIHLVPPEDGAMIETFDGSPGFSVTLRNCNPPPPPSNALRATSAPIKRAKRARVDPSAAGLREGAPRRAGPTTRD